MVTLALVILLMCGVLVPASNVRGADRVLPLRGQALQSGSAVLVIAPATAQVDAGSTVTITVQVQAGALQVDGGAAYLDFDPALLQVEQITTVGPLTLAIQNAFDNTTGRVDYAAGTLGATASGTFDLVQVRFRGAAAGVAAVTFQRTPPRSSDVTAGGSSVLGSAVAGAITVSQGSEPTATATTTPTNTPTITPTLQSGSAVLAIAPATAQVDAGDTVTITVQVQAGALQVDGGAAYLDFDPALLQVEQITTVGPLNLAIQNAFDNTTGRVDYAAGTLGAAASGTFDLVQVRFRGLATGAAAMTFQRTPPRSSDVVVGGSSVLGSVVVGAITITPALQPGSAALAIVPVTSPVTVGSVVTVTVQVQAGAQLVDGAAAYLNFDPTLVQAEQVSGVGPLNLVIQNSFDNTTGRVDYAAGTFSDLPSGTFDLLQVRFRGVNTGTAALTFQHAPPRSSDITSGGGSILSSVVDGAVVVSQNAPPSVRFASASYSVNENAGSATVTVTLSAASGFTVTVGYTAGAASGALTFAPGVTSRIFAVAIADNARDESNWTIALALGNPANATLGSPATATLTVVDDDPAPSVRFASAAFSASENDGSAIATVTLSAASGFAVTVDYMAGAANGVLTFAPGVTSRTFAVAIADNALDEPDWAIPLALGNPANAVLGSPATAALTVVDDDPAPSVQFSSATYSANENAGSATVTVTLSAASGFTVTVNYTAGAANGVLTFAPGVTSRTFTVAIADNARDEPNWTIALAFGNPANATLGIPATATLTVVDDDPAPTAQFSSAVFSANENDGSATVAVMLSAASGFTVIVDYNAGASSGALTFAPGVTSRTFAVAIADNSIDEPDWTIPLTLGNPVNATVGNPATATLTVLDNDGLLPSVRFASASYSASENGGSATVTVNLSAASGLAVTVDYTAGAANGVLTFAPGVTSRTFSVAIANNARDESNWTVPLALGNPANATLGSPATANLTVVDDDLPPSVQFSSASYSADENAGSATVTVTLSAASGFTVTVDYTAGAENGVLTFLPGVTSRTFAVAIADNARDGPDWAISLALSNPANATLGSPATATLNVADDDPPPTVQFSSASYNADESAGSATVTVILGAASGFAVTVDYGIGENAPSRASAAGQVVFAPGATSQTFAVTWPDDAIEEPDQALSLALLNPVQARLSDPAHATLHIADDDDPPSVAFAAAAFTAAEAGGPAPITVTLSAPSGFTVTVDYTISAETGGVIHTGQVVFGPVATTATFAVALDDDNLDEPDAVRTLLLANPTHAVLASPDNATLTIADDDPPPVANFASTAPAVAGEAGSATIDVQLSGPSGYVVTVAYVVGDPTPAGAHATVVQAGALTFPPGSVLNSFVVTWDGAASSQDRVVALTLTGADHATLGANATAMLTIRRAEPTNAVYLPLVTQR